jgi:hypothetical protein
MAITPVTTNLPGITFAVANTANLAVANSQTGNGTLSDIINPVSLAKGKITSDDTLTAITGAGTEFLADFNVGDYLFYYDIYTAVPALLGRIATISSDTSLILEENALSTQATGVYCGATNRVVRTQDSILMRIPVPITGPNQFSLPNWNNWLSIPRKYGAWNDETTNNLERISKPLNPNQLDTEENIQYTIKPLFGWPSTEALVNGAKVFVYFPTTASIPTNVYALLNPYGTGNQTLAPNTLFKIFANSNFNLNCIRAGLNYPQSNLKEAGYFDPNISVSPSTSTSTE